MEHKKCQPSKVKVDESTSQEVLSGSYMRYTYSMVREMQLHLILFGKLTLLVVSELLHYYINTISHFSLVFLVNSILCNCQVGQDPINITREEGEENVLIHCPFSAVGAPIWRVNKTLYEPLYRIQTTTSTNNKWNKYH